ncbi:MAG: M20/M25/M40 family metallo-hydrolase, partial [Kangiellaceae bacterium]|nr:M20/M25/M40 family metallo-hydrolase [Kangiellaceae bacterium]
SNVIGVLEGSDPELKNEYVVLTSHLDHLGSRKDRNQQRKFEINNGAIDNASGIAVMLEIARRLSSGERPKRSILFLAVTAEEQGLLGSNYFVHNPPVPLSTIIANVNLDMVAMLYPFADVIAFGAEHSTLSAAIKTAAIQNKTALSPDPMPEQAIFVRSDHYSFVKKGIPSIYLMIGLGSKDPEINGAKVFMDFYRNHYHQPTDNTSLPINYDAGADFTKISLDALKTIGNDAAAPSWNEGSFFGKAFN